MGLRLVTHFMHNGRATTPEQAIECTPARGRARVTCSRHCRPRTGPHWWRFLKTSKRGTLDPCDMAGCISRIDGACSRAAAQVSARR